MTENKEKKNIVSKDQKEEGTGKTTVVKGILRAEDKKTNSPKRSFKKNIRQRKSRGRFERPKPEFEQKIIDIRRVTRVVKGGRRFSFSVAVVIGNKKGSVGVGIGKAGDTALAIEKAVRDAKKHLLKLKLTKNMSVPHEVSAKYCASDIVIRTAKGRGVVAGSSVRTVLELVGATEVGGKILSRSKNKLNNARAALKALSEFQV